MVDDKSVQKKKNYGYMTVSSAYILIVLFIYCIVDIDLI